MVIACSRCYLLLQQVTNTSLTGNLSEFRNPNCPMLGVVLPVSYLSGKQVTRCQPAWLSVSQLYQVRC